MRFKNRFNDYDEYLHEKVLENAACDNCVNYSNCYPFILYEDMICDGGEYIPDYVPEKKYPIAEWSKGRT